MDSGPRGEICTSCQNGCEQARASILQQSDGHNGWWMMYGSDTKKTSKPQRKWNKHSSFLHHINIMIHFSFVTLPPCVKKWCNPFSNRHGITPNGTKKNHLPRRNAKSRTQERVVHKSMSWRRTWDTWRYYHPLIFHRIHGIGIFTYINHEHQLNV